MKVKVLKLITGEQVITQLSDAKNDSGDDIGFLLTYPYVVVMQPMEQIPGQPIKFDVNYLVWMSASSDTEFVIPYTSVIAISNAAPEVESAYKKQFGAVE